MQEGRRGPSQPGGQTAGTLRRRCHRLWIGGPRSTSIARMHTGTVGMKRILNQEPQKVVGGLLQNHIEMVRLLRAVQ
jgi:hypothetical protein